jgi:hypothetical protein
LGGHFGSHLSSNFVEMDSTFSKGILPCGQLWEFFFPHQIFTLPTNIPSGNKSIIMILTTLKDTHVQPIQNDIQDQHTSNYVLNYKLLEKREHKNIPYS